ncbi:MAG: hypothetical protein AAB804_01645 [Patescibacteria group bacterium]
MPEDTKVAGTDSTKTDVTGVKAEARAEAGHPFSNGQIVAGIATLLVVALLAVGLGYALATKPEQQARTTPPPAPIAKPVADPRGPAFEVGGRQPDASTQARAQAQGWRVEKGRPGDPDCTTLPNGNTRCPNRWVKVN